MNGFLSAVGKKIQARRKQLKISLPELAKQAGVSKGNISKMENEPCNIGLVTLWKLSIPLKTKIKNLLP